MQPVFDEKQLTGLKLEGYKSIKACALNLGALNVLIGANGAGKSNFISFFRLIGEILAGNLQTYISKQGGPDSLLRHGRKHTETLKAEIHFGNNGYFIDLEPTNDNRIMFRTEGFWWNLDETKNIGTGHFESNVDKGPGTGINHHVLAAMKSWRVYHFHDTSESAKVKQAGQINDNQYLRQDGRNLAAYLLRLMQKHTAHYNKIVRTIQLVVPFFGDFHLRPAIHNTSQIELEWTEKGMDVPLKAYALSDGTLRFICLTTVLNQPEQLMPSTLLIDEPELGLHPYAITVLAAQLKTASEHHQVIVSTQSVELVNEFEADDLIVGNRQKGETVFSRINEDKLNSWLEEYSLGEIWKKNLIGGRPSKWSV